MDAGDIFGRDDEEKNNNTRTQITFKENNLFDASMVKVVN